MFWQLINAYICRPAVQVLKNADPYFPAYCLQREEGNVGEVGMRLAAGEAL